VYLLFVLAVSRAANNRVFQEGGLILSGAHRPQSIFSELDDPTIC